MKVYLCFGFDGTPYGLQQDAAQIEEDEHMPDSEKSIRLAAMAQQRAREKNVSYATALSEIFSEHPRLAAEARYEVTGVTPRPVETRGMIGHASLSDASIEPDEELLLLARERAKGKIITFGEALAQIGRERPELARRYRESVMHKKI